MDSLTHIINGLFILYENEQGSRLPYVGTGAYTHHAVRRLKGSMTVLQPQLLGVAPEIKRLCAKKKEKKIHLKNGQVPEFHCSSLESVQSAVNVKSGFST